MSDRRCRDTTNRMWHQHSGGQTKALKANRLECGASLLNNQNETRARQRRVCSPIWFAIDLKANIWKVLIDLRLSFLGSRHFQVTTLLGTKKKKKKKRTRTMKMRDDAEHVDDLLECRKETIRMIFVLWLSLWDFREHRFKFCGSISFVSNSRVLYASFELASAQLLRVGFSFFLLILLCLDSSSFSFYRLTFGTTFETSLRRFVHSIAC